MHFWCGNEHILSELGMKTHGKQCEKIFGDYLRLRVESFGYPDAGWKMKSFYIEISPISTLERHNIEHIERALNPVRSGKHCTILQTIWLLYFTFACRETLFPPSLHGHCQKCRLRLALDFFFVNDFCCCRVIRWQQNSSKKREFWQQHFHNLLQYLLRLKRISLRAWSSTACSDKVWRRRRDGGVEWII